VSGDRQRKQERLLLGQAIGQIRSERGLTVGDLADATGTGQTLIRAVEGGRHDPTFELLIALAGGLGVRPSAFVIRAEELKTDEHTSGEAADPD
jgi:transcriptional regulator with XRE-family HTH domain